MKMKIFQALDAEYFAIRSLHSDSGDLGARILALAFMGPQFAPVIYSFLQFIGAVSGRSIFLISLAASYFLMYVLIDLPRHSLNKPLLLENNLRGRIVLSIFVFIVPIIVIVTSATSPILGLAVFTLVSSVPLQRWMSLPSNPRKAG